MQKIEKKKECVRNASWKSGLVKEVGRRLGSVRVCLIYGIVWWKGVCVCLNERRVEWSGRKEGEMSERECVCVEWNQVVGCGAKWIDEEKKRELIWIIFFMRATLPRLLIVWLRMERTQFHVAWRKKSQSLDKSLRYCYLIVVLYLHLSIGDKKLLITLFCCFPLFYLVRTVTDPSSLPK